MDQTAPGDTFSLAYEELRRKHRDTCLAANRLAAFDQALKHKN